MENTQTPDPSPNPENPKPSKNSPFGLGRIIGLISAAALIVGAALPWGEVAFFTVTGLEGDGKITIGIAIVAGILLLIKKVPLWITIILGIVATAIGVYDFQGMLGANEGLDLGTIDNEFAVSVGIGLYLTVIGGIGLIVGPIIGYIQKKK